LSDRCGLCKQQSMWYNAAMLELGMGDVVQLRKPHPCGSYEWRVVRLGADIGLRCQTCNHRVLLPRSELERRVKSVVSRAGEEMLPQQER
jgi:hypothetical protein